MHQLIAHPNRLAGTILALLLVVLLAGCNFSLAADVTPPPGYQSQPEVAATVDATAGPLFPLVPPDPAKGQAIYEEKCAPCHGSDGLGNGPRAAQLPNPAAPLGSPELARQAVPSNWFNIVTNGNLERFMPPFQSLTDRQRWDVVAYALALSHPAAVKDQGAALYEQNCAACHGAQGQGDGPDAADLRPGDFTNQERMAARSQADLYQTISAGGQGMPAFGEKLAEAERWLLADYVRSLSFGSAVPPAAAGTPAAQATPAAAGVAATPAAGQAVTTTAEITPTQALGTITGLVMSASGQAIPAGTEIMLHSFDHMQIVGNYTTTLAADGSYVFADIEMPEGRSFLTTLEFGGVPYGSDIGTVEPGQTSLELPIQVYETTTDTSGLSIDRLHFFFELVGEDLLRVGELYIVSNPGDKTVAAAEAGSPVLQFTLPPGATNLQFQDGQLGGRFLETDGGFADTTPIRPGMGNYQVLFSYDLPYSRKLDLARPVNLPVDALVILVPEDGIKVKSDAIQDAGTRDVQGMAYHMYTGGGLQAGSELDLTISGSAASGGATLSSGSTTSLLIGLAALGVVLLGAGIWLYRRSRSADDDDDSEDSDDGPLAPEDNDPAAIMDAILALDDQYQEGQLPEEAYQKRRAELKAQLQSTVATRPGSGAG